MATTGDRACRGECARIFYPAAFELTEHHPLARVFEVNFHCQRHYTDTPGNDYRYPEDAVLELLTRRRVAGRLFSDLTGI